MIERPEYVSKLIAYKDTDFIKVITGVRRCGKSHASQAVCESPYTPWRWARIA